MRFAFFILVLLYVVFAHDTGLSENAGLMTEGGLSKTAESFLLKTEWTDFKTKFSKTYSGEEEEQTRYEIFVSNVEKAARWNMEDGTDVFGITQFSDMTDDEMRYYYLNYRPAGEKKNIPVHTTKSSTPTNWDWRDQSGVVTAVKNQVLIESFFSNFSFS